MKSFLLKVGRAIIDLIHKINSKPTYSPLSLVKELPGPGPSRSRITGIAKAKRAARQRKAAR